MSEKNLLILGASGDIAAAVAKRFARNGWSLLLASRDINTLERLADGFTEEFGVGTWPIYFDALKYDEFMEFYKNLPVMPDGVVIAFGVLGDQKKAEFDSKERNRIIQTNYVAAAHILEVIASDFEKKKSGFIVAVSSVAGERGRASNYIYGSSKSALTAYMSGLRNRLSGSGVQVMTVIPGYVRTKMTAAMVLPKFLTVTPENAANAIFNGINRKKDIAYIHWIWRWIMAVIRLIPERIFKKTNF